ncbi:MAG: GNAT family N-acetyltransferase [Planctomycetota bacterium JB042]
MFERDLGDGDRLRTLTEDDAPELFALVDANRADLRRWLPWVDGTVSVDDVRAFVRGATERAAAGRGLTAAIVAGGRIAGVIGFHDVDAVHRSTSIGYWLAEACRGRGLVTRSVRVLVDHAFREWEVVRVEIRCAVGNTASRAIPERLGFRLEGVLRRAENLGGRFVDVAVLSMLDDEWAPGGR